MADRFECAPYLYGKLNQEIRPLYYTGLPTDTAIITVSNNNATLAVDVYKVPHSLNITIGSTLYTFDGSRDVSIVISAASTSAIDDVL